MSSVTYFEFNDLFERRNSDLTDEEKGMAVAWAADEIDLCVEEWKHQTNAMWEIDPKWEMRPFYEHLSSSSEENLERYFWGVSLIECCPRHMGDAPIAIDSEETTPKASDEDLCYCCKSNRRHLLRMLKRAYELAAQRSAARAWRIRVVEELAAADAAKVSPEE